MTTVHEPACRLPVPASIAEPVQPRELVALYQPALGAAARTYKDWVMSLRALDPVTSEVVRLRCARTHDCRLCQSLRSYDARVGGFGSDLDAAIDHYEDAGLDERHVVALRLVDAYVTRPGDIDGALADDVRRLFSAEEVAELLLDLSKWSTQKVHVALRIDAPRAADQLFTIAEDGNLVYVDPIPGAGTRP